MNKLIIFYKPFGVISQFSPHPKYKSLKDYIKIKNFYPAGRLDADSEGLLILTNNGNLQQNISNPKNKLIKTYLALVEREPTNDKLLHFSHGLDLGEYITKPAKIQILDNFKIQERKPAIRIRKNIKDVWVKIEIYEGKNRQIRKMCAKIGHPCLRLIRIGIGKINLFDLNINPGEYKFIYYNKLYF